MRLLSVSVATLVFGVAALSWAFGDDQEIAREISEGLRQEQKQGNLRGFDINLKVAEGNVLLKGNVSSQEHYDLAEGIAVDVDGVKQVVNELLVQAEAEETAASESPGKRPAMLAVNRLDVPVQRPLVTVVELPERDSKAIDRAITTALARELSALKESGKLKEFRLKVDVRDGIVQLRGEVLEETQRKLLLTTTRGIDGVQEVIDGIDLLEPTVRLVASCASLSDTDIQDVSDLTVTAPEPLPRTAANDPARTPSSNPASDEMGPQLKAPTPMSSRLNRSSCTDSPTPKSRVRNALYQGDTQRNTASEQILLDRRIGEELTARLRLAKLNGSLQGFAINVHIEDGNVWLKGRVKSAEQQSIALDLASTVQGVQQVINDLSVESVETSAPANAEPETIAVELGRRLEMAESLGSLTDAHLDVKIDGTTVILAGNVVSADQAQMALELARQTPGVTGVRNELIVQTEAIGQPERLAGTSTASGQVMTASTAMTANVDATGPVSYGGLPGTMVSAPAQAAAFPGSYGYHAGNQTPLPAGATRLVSYAGAALAAPFAMAGQMAGAMPAHMPSPGRAVVPSRYDHPNLPGYAWPSYAAHPNYAAVTYPKQYSPSAWPYIGPFYPYPQVPLGWRKVTLKWDDGWWMLDFNAK